MKQSRPVYSYNEAVYPISITHSQIVRFQNRASEEEKITNLIPLRVVNSIAWSKLFRYKFRVVRAYLVQ